MYNYLTQELKDTYLRIQNAIEPSSQGKEEVRDRTTNKLNGDSSCNPSQKPFLVPRVLGRRKSLPSHWNELGAEVMRPSSGDEADESLLDKALRLKTRIQKMERSLAANANEMPTVQEESLIENVLDLEMRSLMIEERLKLVYDDPSSASWAMANEIILFYETYKLS